MRTSAARGARACRVACWIALALGATMLGGCATVAPWERGDLARPEMAARPDPALARLRDHVFTSREAAQGGGAAAGGACGCN